MAVTVILFYCALFKFHLFGPVVQKLRDLPAFPRVLKVLNIRLRGKDEGRHNAQPGLKGIGEPFCYFGFVILHTNMYAKIIDAKRAGKGLNNVVGNSFILVYDIKNARRIDCGAF